MYNTYSMKAEAVIFILTIFFIYNAYSENKYTKYLLSLKKYYNMAVIGFAGLSFYLFVKKYPQQAFSGVSAARQLLKTLPVDKSAGYMFDPIFQNVDVNFSGTPATPSMNYDNSSPVNRIGLNLSNLTNPKAKTGGTTTTKRSVGETKKKYVASQQGWQCGHCQKQLNAWFEVDHRRSLETGGSNHVSNLVALCRECHGKKTAMERMGML